MNLFAVNILNIESEKKQVGISWDSEGNAKGNVAVSKKKIEQVEVTQVQQQKTDKLGGFARRTLYRHPIHKRISSIRFSDKGENKKKDLREKEARSYKKLVVNTCVCGLIALAVVGIKYTDTPFTNMLLGHIEDAVNTDFVIDEDIGKLKFVNSDHTIQDTAVMSRNIEAFHYPLEGEVITPFDEQHQGATIQPLDDKQQVKCIKDGTVAKVIDSTIVMQNQDGSITLYDGIDSKIEVGAQISSGDALGALSKDCLYVETLVNGEYVDPLKE